MINEKGQFVKGNAPHNKGTKGLMVAWNKDLKGWTNSGSFKNGHIAIGGFEKGHPGFKKEKNGNWKGDDVGYNAIHSWLKREFGLANKCENPNCIYPRAGSMGRILYQSKRFDWANLSGKYKRDRNDWKMLCCSCHKLYDLGKIKL